MRQFVFKCVKVGEGVSLRAVEESEKKWPGVCVDGEPETLGGW